MSRTAILCLPAQSALHAEPLLRSQDFKPWEMNGVNSSWEPGEGSESVCGFLCLSCPAAFWFCSLPHSKELSDCRRGSAKCRLRSWGQLWAVTPLKTSGYNRTLAHSPLRPAGLQSSKLLGEEEATSALRAWPKLAARKTNPWRSLYWNIGVFLWLLKLFMT